MSSSKKRQRRDGSPPLTQKRSKTVSLLDAKCETDSDNRTAEILSSQTIREGMLVLGCVAEINKTSLLISLPGCLTGTVPFTNISKAFTDSLKNFSEDSKLEEHKNEELPCGTEWTEHISSSGKKYFYNSKRDISQWTTFTSPALNLKLLGDTEWSEHISSSGSKYYYNSKRDHSQWTKPKEVIEWERSKERIGECGLIENSCKIPVAKGEAKSSTNKEHIPQVSSDIDASVKDEAKSSTNKEHMPQASSDRDASVKDDAKSSTNKEHMPQVSSDRDASVKDEAKSSTSKEHKSQVSSHKDASSDHYQSDSDRNDIPVKSFVQTGMVFPCKVMQISQDLHKRKPSIVLSINPEDVNAELKPSSLYLKMVLYVSVSSVEDHGYIVDVGNNCIKGFLPRQECRKKGRELNIGEVIPTFVKNITSNKTSVKIQLSLLDFNKENPEIIEEKEKIKLHSILPGARIRCVVIEVHHPFVFAKYSCFEACGSVLSLGSSYKTIDVGQTISGTVLYVEPITHMIYLMLNLKPTPGNCAEYFGLKKYTSIENPKFQFFYKNCAYYKISKGAYGFIYAKELKNSSESHSSEPHSSKSPDAKNAISKACVTSFHYMDNLVQMTTNLSLLEKNIILPEDVQIGDIYDGIVKKHMEGGMVIEICPGLSGFVRKILMSDIPVTKPEITFPGDSSVKCRVLSVSGTGQLNLTCQESLLQLQSQYILSSYNNAKKGQFYKGVIVNKSNDHIIVLFFNDIQGISPVSLIPEDSIFYEGQVVLCEIISCNPKKKKLVISLKTSGRSSIEELKDLDDLPKVSGNVKKNKSEKKKTYNTRSKPLPTKSSKVVSKFDSKIVGKSDTISLNKSATKSKYSATFNEKGTTAKIINTKKSQLNIQIDNLKGRVHITELGCLTEDRYPLREFSHGQNIQVFMYGEYERRKKNYLENTHRNTVTYKECSLKWPPLSLSLELKPGDSVIGFVKEVHEVSAVLWITRAQTGMLDFLHFSENVKIVKDLKQQLKFGQSVKASVLAINAVNHRITLTKIGENLPQVGKNVLGLVQVASLEGLTLKLPFGYHGTVALTDLTDVYIPAEQILDKYQKLKFLKCYVLEVNHQTKQCQLSLRKSKVYGHKIPQSEVCPEITEDCIKEGMALKGFVKSIMDSDIIVELGRSLTGKMKGRTSTTLDSDSVKNSVANYSIGSVIEVVVKGKSTDSMLVLDLKESETVDNSGHTRLNVSNNASWEEMQ